MTLREPLGPDEMASQHHRERERERERASAWDL